MTKYKEYLKAHGIKVQCDYEAEYCHGIDAIDTTVLNNGIIVGVHHASMGYCYAACDRSGAWSHFCDCDLGMHLEELHYYDPEYLDFLFDTGCNKSFAVLETMKQMYLDDAKVRIAFKHMKAGIMDYLVFYGWISDRYQLIAAIKRNEAAEKPMLPTKEDCAPAPSEGYAGNTDRSVDYKVYRVTKKQLDYLTYLLARYGDSSKTPRQLTPAEVSKSIKILRRRGTHDAGRSYNATEERKEIVKEQYLKNLYALISVN